MTARVPISAADVARLAELTEALPETVPEAELQALAAEERLALLEALVEAEPAPEELAQELALGEALRAALALALGLAGAEAEKVALGDAQLLALLPTSPDRLL